MKYNDLIYNSGPTNIKDYVNDRYNIVHNKLYEDALYNYVYSFTKNLVMKEMLYNLFNYMNNCITEFNDINEIVDLDKISELKENKLYKIFTINEINENELYEQSYFDILKTYINDNGHINNVFDLLDITEDIERDNYIKYIVINIISLIQDIKVNIKNEINYNLDINNDFSDFIIRYKNSLYIIDEASMIDTQENYSLSLLTTEISDGEIFIYEDQYKMDYHIGYNSDGYFILDINPEINITSNYDKLYYIMSYINNLLFDIMFNDITYKYINNNTIIEKPQKEYYLPSTIIIYENKFPHKKKVIDLAPYWSDYNDHSNINIEDIKYSNESIVDAQINDIDYINGKVKIYSKMNDQEYIIDKKYINENINIDDELIKKTFFQNI